MKKLLISLTLLVFAAGVARSQSIYQPYSYDFYQKLNADVYSTKTRVHSSLKPYFADDSLLRFHYDSLMNYGTGMAKGTSFSRLFNGHQVEANGTNSTFYTDLLPDFTYGRDFTNKKPSYLTSLGLQFGGTVGKKFSYYAAGFLNGGKPLNYIATYINQTAIVPGQAHARVWDADPQGYNWSYITAVASYTPNKYLNISAGRDKTFVGDGYRSLLLSDYSSPYPFLKLTASLGNVKYMAMWGYFADPASTSDLFIDRKKWGVFHYLDWNVSNRLSFGFFDAIVWPNTDDAGHHRGFELSYINPLLFLRPIEAANGSPDNALIGFTGKYKLTDGLTAYGQFALDEFEAKNFFSNSGSSRNKSGFQLGVRGANLFGVRGLNYLAEVNNVRPFTYSERQSIVNYSNNSEPLAHPWGANFREVLGLLNYSYKRFDFSGEVDYGRYGLDYNNLNYGKDIFLSYRDPVSENGNFIGQGLTTNMVLVQGKVAYLLNPRYNLRLELGGTFRNEKNSAFLDRSSMITFGLRSSFRTMYSDLASYKTH